MITETYFFSIAFLSESVGTEGSFLVFEKEKTGKNKSRIIMNINRGFCKEFNISCGF